MRTPSRVATGYRAAKCSAARCTIANLRSSGQSTRSSGVDTVWGRSASRRESGPPPLRQVAQQPRGGEQGVVEAVPVAGEEHVAAHLPCERRVQLLHPLLDEG